MTKVGFSSCGGAALALAMVLATSTASADVAWSAPAECPTAEDVNRRVRALAPEGAREADAAVTVTLDGDHHARAEVRVTAANGGEGSRRLEANGCADVAEAVALVVAMSLQEADPPEPPRTSAPTQAPGPRDEGASRQPSSSRASFTLAALGAMDVGTMSRASFGGSVAAGVAWRAWRGEAQGQWLADQTIETGPGVGGTFSQWAVTARGCFLPALGPVKLGPCAGLGVHRIGATGFGTTIVRTRAQAVAAPEVSLLFLWSVARPVAVRAQAAASVPLARPTFVLDDVGPVHRPGPLALALFLGPEVVF